ncbi:MAG: FGGY-family carbohydrate kinase [Gloeobacterales cyanobacterium]
MSTSVFLGIDLGTSGLRAVALTEQGELRAVASHTWAKPQTDPQQWLATLKQVLRQVKLPGTREQMVALSICGTSGTVLPVDAKGHPLDTAWLYDDPRGKAQAQQLGISSSWGLSRWLWWAQTAPGLYEESYLAHPNDFLLHQLGAEPHITDHTSALKSGFDLDSYSWPKDWLASHQLTVEKFPKVVPPGTPLGYVSKSWGLGENVLLVAGLTDGCAGQLATGAIAPGQISTSLGTTLIFKAVSQEKIQTADGSIYSHLHPDRTSWLPGAASSCGGGALNHFFPQADLAALDQAAASLLPTGLISYPLWQRGERYPVHHDQFAGFLPEEEVEPLRFYAALLEGVGFVERLGIERLQPLGLLFDGPVHTTGGGCRSPLWLTIRANILNRALILAKYPQPAVGAAMVAAAGVWQCPVEEAVQKLFREGKTILPEPERAKRYDGFYQQFLHELEARQVI